MKLLNEKPYENGMRFFTPDLYLAFNSPDDAATDQADEEWEQRLLYYRRRLEQLRLFMPASVQKLSRLCLHDADVLSLEKMPPLSSSGSGAPSWSPMTAILTVRQGETVTDLIYFLWENITESLPVDEWPLSKTPLNWLYDEVDSPDENPGVFLHRILMSNGSTIEIPFINLMIHQFVLSAPEKAHETNRELSATG